MADLIDNLRKKGWAQDEIDRVAKIIQEAPEKKSPRLIFLDKTVYWTGLVLAIIGNFVVSVVLIPFLILMRSFYLYLALMFMGVLFGWIFSILLIDIESIQTGQKVMAWVFIPAIGVINIYVMTNLSNFIATLMEIESGIHVASMVSIVYVAAFMFPYSITKLLKKQSL